MKPTAKDYREAAKFCRQQGACHRREYKHSKRLGYTSYALGELITAKLYTTAARACREMAKRAGREKRHA